MRFSNFTKEINNNLITIPEWVIDRSENWAVIGNNGSGKTLLGEILSAPEISESVGYISFEKVEALLEEERKKDDTDFMDKLDPGTLVKDYLSDLKGVFDLENIKDRGLKFLSTGELTKVVILKELEKNPDYLVLDEPYDGLDIESQGTLYNFIEELIKSEITLILILNRESDIHPLISHVAFMHNNRLILQGEKDDILNSESFNTIRHFSGNIPETLPGIEKFSNEVEELILFNNVSIAFGETKVLNNISWRVNTKDHYKIIGPNGSGKSTLLKIVSADNHQSYGQDITLFGMKRGTGESIWDIKKHIGLVSSTLQKDYRVSISVLNVILSGYFDTIGLYDIPTPTQISEAKEWIKIIGLYDKKENSFKELSYGEQRVILIIRAMVKHPKILILDEPCLGLDQVNRELILLLLDSIAKKGETTLLYVSHRKEDYIESIKKELYLEPSENGSLAIKKERE